MKRTSVWLTAALTVCVLRAADSAQQKRDADETVLGAALHQEEVEGNLEKAIAAFKDFLARNPSDRALAAMAQFHIGLCYEKLGNAEAQKAYQQVLSTYADQTEIASQARTRLAALLQSVAEAARAQASRLVFRKITIPGKISAGARLSSDGTRLAFASGGDIWVVNLHGEVAPEVAGATVRLTQGANATWTGLTWSGDGQWIAFNENKVPTRDMYVLPVSGGAPRKLSRAVPLWGGANWFLGLSPGGSRLAYSTGTEDGDFLQIVSVETGETMMRLANPDAIEPVFSPDDKRIAYVRLPAARLKEYRSEVRVVRLSDRSDVRVTETPWLTRSPAWSPDGSLLAFLVHPDKNEPSLEELWITPVLESGEGASEPTKIRLPRFASSIAGWTMNNEIGLLSPSPSRNAIYAVPLSGGKATQVTPNGDTFLPQWSPDGGRIYFRWGAGDIAFVPAAGGQVAVVPRSAQKVTEALPAGGNHISPDGRRIVFAGAQPGVEGVKLWTMPVTGGEPVRLPMNPDLNAWQPRWSPDGKWIAFESERDVPGERGLDENIFIVSSEGGEPRQLTNHTDCFCELEAWSPAGDSIAYACSDKTIRIIPIKGGEPRVVQEVDGLESHQGSLAWTPDGARLLYTAKGRIWTVSVAGGEATAISTGLDGDVLQFALSPDGQRIAFNVPSGQEPELWLMEDFLSLVKGRK